MSILIIYAHPKTEGFCSYILETIQQILINQQREFEILDLYDMNYDAVLKKEELYSAGNRKISSINKEIQEKIKKSETLLFIYPVWWGCMPAILKGFLDRVITPGFGFKYQKKNSLHFIPKKLLKQKKALVFMTAGSPRLAYLATGNPPKKIIKTFTLGTCGIDTTVIQFFNAKHLNEKRKAHIKKRIKKIF